MWVAIKKNYRQQAKSWSFFGLLLLPILLLIFGSLFHKTQQVNPDVTRVGVVSNLPATFKDVKDVGNKKFTFTKLNSKKEARRQLQKNKIDGILIVHTSSTSRVQARLVTKANLNFMLENKINRIAHALQIDYRSQTIHLDSAIISQITQPAKSRVQQVVFQGKKMKVVSMGAVQSNYRLFIVLSSMLLLLIILVLPNLIEEKKPKSLDYRAQAWGTWLIAVTNFLVWSLAVVGLALQGPRLNLFQLGSTNWLWLGNLLSSLFAFSSLFLVIFSLQYLKLKKPQQGVSQYQLLVMTVSLFLIVNLIIGSHGADGLLSRIFSYLPGLAMFSMPLRLLTGTATLTEGLLSWFILCLSGGGVYYLLSREENKLKKISSFDK